MTIHPGTAALAALLILGGCDRAFGLDDRDRVAGPDAAPEVAPYSRCGAFLSDDPLRYAAITSPLVAEDGGAAPWSWDAARAMCRQRGMDLAVVNDDHELGMAEVPPAWPFWIGAQLENSTWTTVDECPMLAPPPPGTVQGCGVVNGPLDLGVAACSGQLPPTSDPSVVTSALCETPRPMTASCLGNDPVATRYVRSIEPVDHEGAVEFCKSVHGHVVSFESHAEWTHVSQLTTDTIKARFWVGSTFDGTVWTTSTGCPATYSWHDGTPGTPAAGSCLASTLRVNGEEPESAGLFLDGVTPTECSDADEMFALCEVD
jgi:hypothetical protein